jgi:parallel beta-helix repeat protein
VKGGDRILLMDGDHGPLVVRGARFDSPVIIQAEDHARVHVSSITLNDAANVTFRHLAVWPNGVDPKRNAVIIAAKNTDRIVFDTLDVRSAPDATDYVTWPVQMWQANKINGLLVQGTRTAVRNIRVTGVYNGILVTGDASAIEDSVVDGFAGDGMRALGNNSRISRNRIQNCFVINKSHRDGIQSYSRGPNGKPGAGTQRDLVIEGNRILEWTLGRNSPLRCELQGISLFDGMFDSIRIENNVVVMSAYHGITVAGGLNSIIRNNTVVAANGQPGRRPWIRVSAHKNGTPSKNVLVADNLANFFPTKPDPRMKIIFTNNVVATPARDFANFGGLDLSLRKGSPAVDAGDPSTAAPNDVTGAPRWKGRGPDAGAYESY